MKTIVSIAVNVSQRSGGLKGADWATTRDLHLLGGPNP